MRVRDDHSMRTALLTAHRSISIRTTNARPKLLRYDQAIDHPSQGVCCVTSAAMILENPDDDEDRRS